MPWVSGYYKLDRLASQNTSPDLEKNYSRKSLCDLNVTCAFVISILSERTIGRGRDILINFLYGFR